MIRSRLYALLALAALAGHAAPTAAIDLPPALQAAIEAMGGPVRVMERTDLDRESCGTPEEDPGLMRADLDGDGAGDYAAVLIFPERRKGYEWQGKIHYTVQVQLVAFMKRGKAFESHALETGEGYLPLIQGLFPVPPGKVEETHATGNRTAQLRNPGVGYYFCEKSSFVTWWEDGTFDRIWTSD